MFGVTNISNRHCVVTGCKKSATTVIGDTKYKFNLKNLFLCDEHLNELYEVLQNQFTNHSEGIEQQNIECNINAHLKDKYIQMLYNNNGMVSKVKLMDLCKENGIEVPEDANMKKIMELIFPELG